MADNTRNRNSQKGNEEESRRGTGNKQKSDTNRKLPDNFRPLDDVSTRGDTSFGKSSKTGKRDDQKNNAEERGEPE